MTTYDRYSGQFFGKFFSVNSRKMSSNASGFSMSEIASQFFNVPLEQVSEMHLMQVQMFLQSYFSPPKREKLSQYNSFEDALALIHQSSKIIVVAGAGISVSCGIPDFRSKNGIYAQLATQCPDLPNPQAMFDLPFFKSNPHPFYDFAKQILPGKFEPSLCHKFIKKLEEKGKLLRLFTQNIDTLERQCGIQNLIECHGSFSGAKCLDCQKDFTMSDIIQDIEEGKVPRCLDCKDRPLPPTEPNDSPFNLEPIPSSQVKFPGLIKPKIIFFGESLPPHFHDAIDTDSDNADLLIVIGSSMQVRPVSTIPSNLQPDIPQILINMESLSYSKTSSCNFDIELLGKSDEICTLIQNKLGWSTEKNGDAEVLLPINIPEPEVQSIILNDEKTSSDVGPTLVQSHPDKEESTSTAEQFEKDYEDESSLDNPEVNPEINEESNSSWTTVTSVSRSSKSSISSDDSHPCRYGGALSPWKRPSTLPFGHYFSRRPHVHCFDGAICGFKPLPEEEHEKIKDAEQKIQSSTVIIDSEVV